jgi:hypothetical protein
MAVAYCSSEFLGASDTPSTSGYVFQVKVLGSLNNKMGKDAMFC